jgi:hypothetical protein
MNKETPMDILEKELVRYQKLALFIFYPALIGMMSAIVGAFTSTYDYALAFALERTIMIHCRDYPLTGNSAVSLLIGVLASALVSAVYGFLTYQAVKAKFWALIVGISLYFADAVYGSLLVISSLPFAMGLLTYFTSLFVHLAFLALYAYLLVRFGKLKRLERKLQGH